MVIQRIQSLYLLLAANIAVMFSFITLADSFTLYQTPALLVCCYATAALIFIDIFLYKHLKLQMLVASVSALLLVVLAVATWLAAPAGEPFNWWGLAFPVFGAILCLFARRGMARDYKLLRSTDRLR